MLIETVLALLVAAVPITLTGLVLRADYALRIGRGDDEALDRLEKRSSLDEQDIASACMSPLSAYVASDLQRNRRQ